MLVKIIFCLMIPLLFFSLILNRNEKHIILCICIGITVCYIACLLNTYFLANSSKTFFYLTTTIAPITEELLKFIPILLISILLKDERDKVFPAAFALGIGFAITENLYMLFQSAESVYIEWVIIRGISTGLMHVMSASIIALGVLEAKKYSKSLRFVGIFATLSLAMIYHGFYNCLVNNTGVMKYIGVVVPIITYLIIFLVYRKDITKLILSDDIVNE